MRALVGHADSSAGFQVTAFALASAKLATSSRAPCPSFAAARTWFSALEGTRRRRAGSHRYSWILASPDDANDVENLAPRGSDGNDDDVSEDAGVVGDEAADGVVPAAPADARQDEKQRLTGEDDANPSGTPESVDWDAAWASTRRKMEEDRKRAPAFSGRKQVVATTNEDGEYDFVEISADGSRKRRGNGGGGFEFAPDIPRGADASGRFRNREREIVDLATTNQAFAVVFAALAAAFLFEVYVYATGGITNGGTRFQGVGQPTTYDARPIPPTAPPLPEEDLSV